MHKAHKTEQVFKNQHWVGVVDERVKAVLARRPSNGERELVGHRRRREVRSVLRC